MKLYFAYGDTMRKTQMLALCPQSRRAGMSQLNRWRWFIADDGRASIEASATGSVRGVLYEIGYADEAALDRNEAVTSGTCSKRCLPVLFNGRTLLALVYINAGRSEGIASDEYARQLLLALADAGLGSEYIEKHVQRYLPATMMRATDIA